MLKALVHYYVSTLLLEILLYNYQYQTPPVLQVLILVTQVQLLLDIFGIVILVTQWHLLLLVQKP